MSRSWASAPALIPRTSWNRWAHPFWRAWVQLEQAEVGYGRGVEAEYEGVPLDAEYEAKCRPYLLAGPVLLDRGPPARRRMERQMPGGTSPARGVGL